MVNITIPDLFRPKEKEKMNSIQLGYGKATFPTSSVTIATFAVEAPFVRNLASKIYTKEGSTLAIPVSRVPQVDGSLYTEHISAPDGAIILIQTSMGFHGRRIRDGALFLRVREDAALQLISVNIPSDTRSTLTTGNHTVFCGRADILTLDELEGAGILPGYRYVAAYMDAEEIDETYTIQEVAREKKRAPVLEVHTAPDGSKVTLKVDKPQRRMRIRK